MIDGAMQDYQLTLDKFLRHASKWHGHAEVVTAQAGRASSRACYAEIDRRCMAMSVRLQACGVGLGDRVATLAWNSQSHLEAWYAIVGIGGVCHTLNPRLTCEQLASMVAQSAAKVIIVSADCLALAKSIVERETSIEQVLVIDGPLDNQGWHGGLPPVSLVDLVESDEAGQARWGAFDETAPASLCFTSGTTGTPKGVTYTHRSSYLHTLRTLQADAMGISSRDSVLAVVPMFHANAWGLIFSVPAVGAKLVLPGRQSSGADMARLIEDENVTLAFGVPTVWVGLLEHVEACGVSLPSLERIIVGGAPMPPGLMERLEARLGVIVQTSWGMTELSPVGTIAPRSDRRRSALVSGRPVIGMDLILTDEHGKALAQQRGVEGHLRVRGPAVVERYFGCEQSESDANGWFATGDLARIDSVGNLTITGRSKDLIKSGGEWINPAEIEAIVGALPEVSMAAVIGRPDAKWGERPVLIVQLRQGQGITDEGLLGALEGAVASWWFPDEVIRLADMPLTPTGKIDKLQLRADHGCS